MTRLEFIIPLTIFILGLAFTIITRLFSNHILNRNYINTLQGNPVHILPLTIAFFNILGSILLVISIVWIFFIKYWLGLIFIAILIISYFIRPKLYDLKKAYLSGNAKRCQSCHKFCDLSYFDIDKESDDGHTNTCMACRQPNV